MIKSKAQFLRELSALSELQDNPIAFVFSDNPILDVSAKEKVFENIRVFYTRYKNNKNNINNVVDIKDLEVDKWKGTDLRIKNVRLKSIRGLPDSSTPFGIDFCGDHGLPQSMVILGGNATGKSSVYHAIEYCYCKEIGEAKLRGVKDNYPAFLQNFNNGVEKTFCKIETVEKLFDIKNPDNIPDSVRKSINPETHFISDYDLYQHGQLNYIRGEIGSLHYTIAKNLGLSDLLEFDKYLKIFISYRRQVESRAINDNERSIKNLKILIEANEISINQKKLSLENLFENQPQSDFPDHDKPIFLINKIISTSPVFSFDSNEMKKIVGDFIQSYSEYSSNAIKGEARNELHFLNLGKELLRTHDDCPLCHSSKLSKVELTDSIESRIKSINQFEVALRKMTGSYDLVVTRTQFLLNQINAIRSLIINEISLIIKNSEFSALAILDNNFISELSSHMSNDIFLKLIKLNEANFNQDKQKYIFEVFTDSDMFSSSIDSLEKTIFEFIKQRSSVVGKISTDISASSDVKSTSDKIAIIKSDIKTLESQIVAGNKNLNDLESKNNALIEQLNLYNEIRAEIESYEKILNSQLNKEISKVFDPIKESVELILNDYFANESREVKLVISKEPGEINEETGEIITEFISANILVNNEIMPVTKYFNTFHYRLFTTMIAISIAVASRVNTGINMPLILDDVFYASDFENKAYIEDFIIKIFKIFNKYTPSMPLQLILFTHDQDIFESASHAFQKSDSINDAEFSLAKLFPCTQSELTNGYNNLIYKFPSYDIRKSIKNG